MHDYRRFVQAELDARGWTPAKLARLAGLRRQLIWNILHDNRPTLGQMPDDSTLEGLARGFNVPVERVREAAARALRGYIDSGEPLQITLSDVSIDALLEEIRRRVVRVPARRADDRPDISDDESQPDEGPFFSKGEP